MDFLPGTGGRSWIRTLNYDRPMTVISKIMTSLAETAKKYPLKCCGLLLCILLLSSFELWGHFYPLPAHSWNIAKVGKINVSDPANFYFAVFGDNKGTKFTK